MAYADPFWIILSVAATSASSLHVPDYSRPCPPNILQRGSGRSLAYKMEPTASLSKTRTTKLALTISSLSQ